jgi:hypothetical protein
MKLRLRSVVWVLPFFLTACFHWPHRQAAQPLAPPLQTASKAPPPTVEHPPLNATIPSVPLATGPTVQSAPKPKPPRKHKKPVSDSSEQIADNTQQGPANTQQAAAESPGVSAIGQLSSGDPSDLRQQTVNSIAATERGLSSITRQLSDQEQKTAAQIREFLKQARAALNSGDVDGAHTLAAKARVLLGELSR